MNYICKQQNTQQQSSNKYEQRLFSALLLAYAKIENSVYSAKHIVGGNFACYVAGVVDVLTQNGRDESSPLFFSNTPDTAFSFVPAVTYCLTNDSPTVAFIRRCSAGRVCCQAVQPYRCRFSYTRSRRAFPLICAAADRPA